jgi:hypothetical protein
MEEPSWGGDAGWGERHRIDCGGGDLRSSTLVKGYKGEGKKVKLSAGDTGDSGKHLVG